MNKYGTLMTVDDNTTILTALRFALEDAFERIITLNNPDDILKTLAQESVDIVLLDMNFSLGVNTGQEGLFWLRAIRKRHPDLPVVLLTAYADVELAVRGLKTGAKDFVVKPWDNAELMRKLRDVLDAEAEVRPLDDVEAEHIRRAVDRCNGNLSEAAKLLGITRQTLYNRLRRNG